MKTMKLRSLGLAVSLYSTLAFAQHGHGGGAMGGGNGMGHGTLDHPGASTKNSTSLGKAQGKTVDQILARDSKLAGKISSLTGQPATQACSDFKNLGQCVAAAHVARNLRISFDCLKSDMTGTAAPASSSCPAGTGTKGMSLGKAIQTLDPTARPKAESKKAEDQAAEDLKGSNS
jgi:hypothetical protein